MAPMSTAPVIRYGDCLLVVPGAAQSVGLDVEVEGVESCFHEQLMRYGSRGAHDFDPSGKPEKPRRSVKVVWVVTSA
jgi:hypothetical protein